MLRHDKKNIIVLTGKEMSSGVGGEPLAAPSLSSNHRGVKTIEPGL